MEDGQFPSTRHDGAPWKKSDKATARLKGQLPAKGSLSEIRGDWDWLKGWLQFPTYHTRSGVPCQTCGFQSHGASCKRPILSEELKTWEKFCALCGLVTWPENIPSELCLPDWLHAVDKGIGADIAGQILVELAPCYEARSFREQTALLWQDIQKPYNVEYRPQTLSPNALSKENQ